MMPFRIHLDAINRGIDLVPKLIAQPGRYLRVFRRDLPGVFGGSWMNGQRLHFNRLSSAKLPEFLLGDACNFTGVQLIGPAHGFFIINPVMGVFQAAQKPYSQFRPLWLRQARNGFPDLRECIHAWNLPCRKRPSSPNFWHAGDADGDWLVIHCRVVFGLEADGIGIEHIHGPGGASDFRKLIRFIKRPGRGFRKSSVAWNAMSGDCDHINLSAAPSGSGIILACAPVARATG